MGDLGRRREDDRLGLHAPPRRHPRLHLAEVAARARIAGNSDRVAGRAERNVLACTAARRGGGLAMTTTDTSLIERNTTQPHPGGDSEVGLLRRVILHRPGRELKRLTPTNKDELLFDDVLW